MIGVAVELDISTKFPQHADMVSVNVSTTKGG
jgi:hypothetical protein